MSNTEIWDAMFFLTAAYLLLMPIAIFFAHRFDNGAGQRSLATALSLAVTFTLSYTLSAAFIFQVASDLPAGLWFSIIVGFMALLAGIAFPLMAYRSKNGIPHEIPANFTASAA